MATVTNLVCEYSKDLLGLDTGQPRISWWMNDTRTGARQTAYRIRVATDPGYQADSVVWETGTVDSEKSILIPYAGKPLVSHTRYYYQVQIRDEHETWSDWSDPEWFETAFLEQQDWRARWIHPDDGDDVGPPPYFRKSFTIEGKMEKARLYAAARGLMELSVNGQPVSDDVLSPGWTDYSKSCQYVTYDVGHLLHEGENVIGAILGDGWFSGRIARVRDGARIFGGRPQLLLELHLSVSGRPSVICSDESWVWRTGGIVSSDIYDGEATDARLEVPDWNMPSAAREGWQAVKVVGDASSSWNGSSDDTPRLSAKVVPPVRRILELRPKPPTEPEPGHFIYDLGQNISGWARLRASAKRDSKITLRFGEMLNDDGTLYVENLRSAKATDSYVCADTGGFVWEPRFTFHGFRYIEVTGLVAPEPEQITGIVVHTDLQQTGTFECSDPLVNRLQKNIQWGQRGNYLEAPTDCPQRDERLGWTGDAQVFVATGAFNMNVAPFFDKWQSDLSDAQGEDGTIPPFAPTVRYHRREEGVDGGPAWSDAFVICPWTLWEKYGDLEPADRHFDDMMLFVRSMERASRDLIRADQASAENCGYGDWVSMDAPAGSSIGATPTDVIGTAYFARSASLLCDLARRLGRDSEAEWLATLHTRIVTAFQKEFVTPSGRVLGDTQTSYALALAFDLLPEQQRLSAVNRLVRKLELRQWRLDTGFVGTPLLCPVLTRFGREDVAYRLLLQQEFPSWLYTVNQGATTMWERWNSYTLAGGFGPASMNSFNHYAYGSIGDWMYSSVAGLRVDLREAGEPPIRIEPHPGHGITSASASLITPLGPSSSSWERDGDTVRLTIELPANASARVLLAPADGRVEARPEDDSTDPRAVSHLGSDASGRIGYEVAAGRYLFTYRCKA